MKSTSLHMMARRYLMGRNEKLRTEYAAIHKGFPRTPGPFTDEEKRIFPRFDAVDAMLREVQRLDPEALPPPDQLAAALSLFAATAQSVFTVELDLIEAEVAAAERELFRAAVEDWSAAPNLVVEPLPYRRVFSDEEAQGWRRRIEARWGFQKYMTSWHPFPDTEPPEGLLILDASAVREGPGTELVRAALRDMGLRRVVEILEHGGPGSLLDLDALELTYTNNSEGIWVDDTLDWIAHASYQNTVAFGGTLAARLRVSWPDVTDWTYVPCSDQPAK